MLTGPGINTSSNFYSIVLHYLGAVPARFFKMNERCFICFVRNERQIDIPRASMHPIGFQVFATGLLFCTN